MDFFHRDISFLKRLHSPVVQFVTRNLEFQNQIQTFLEFYFTFLIVWIRFLKKEKSNYIKPEKIWKKDP